MQAPRRGLPTADDLLNHPDVVGTIRAILVRRGIQGQELADGIAVVQARAWAATANDRPDTVARWQAVCRPIADTYGLDELRKKYARAPHNAGLVENPDEHGMPAPSGERRDPIDVQRALAVLKQQHDEGDMPPRGAEILDALAAGIPQSEQAAELGIKNQTMRNQVYAMRRTFRRRLVAAGLGTLMAASAFFAIWRTHPWRNDQAHNQPTPPAPSAPPPQFPVNAPEQHPTPEERVAAAKLRQEAHDALLKRDWKTCVYRLDDANRLDPAGGSPDTSAEYNKCIAERGLEFEAKPRSR